MHKLSNYYAQTSYEIKFITLYFCSEKLLKYCNKNCHCSKDADFRPICESSGKYTYYSPCYTGCTKIIYVDNVKIYSDCSCVQDMTGWGNDQAKDGPCDSTKCQAGWMLFEVIAILFIFLIHYFTEFSNYYDI